MIEICNLRNEKPMHEFDVRVDRSNKILGNKFVMRDESERELVCKQYEIWLYERVGLQDVDIINELQRLDDIYKKYGRLRLFCWCSPKKCHAETIKELLLHSRSC